MLIFHLSLLPCSFSSFHMTTLTLNEFKRLWTTKNCKKTKRERKKNMKMKFKKDFSVCTKFLCISSMFAYMFANFWNAWEESESKPISQSQRACSFCLFISFEVQQKKRWLCFMKKNFFFIFFVCFAGLCCNNITRLLSGRKELPL